MCPSSFESTSPIIMGVCFVSSKEHHVNTKAKNIVYVILKQRMHILDDDFSALEVSIDVGIIMMLLY